MTDGFSWIGSSYALSSTAVIPWFGGLAHIFGRRPATLLAIGFFTLGSIICAAAQTSGMLIAGRTIQGVGGGGILSLCEVHHAGPPAFGRQLTSLQIVICDLVPQVERGVYQGLLGLVWAIASAIGPPIGGASSLLA
jgi:MFS family permease